MSNGDAFKTKAHNHIHEGIFEGGPWHNQVRAIEEAEKVIDINRLVGNIPTGLVNLETRQYVRQEKPLSDGPNATRWRYIYVPHQEDKDV